MIRKKEDMREVERENLLGGRGTVRMRQLLEPEEMRGKMRVCSMATLPPGASVGEHDHTIDSEIYYVLEGEVRVRDNEDEHTLCAGDIMFTCEGETHQMWNASDKEATLLFVVMNI